MGLLNLSIENHPDFPTELNNQDLSTPDDGAFKRLEEITRRWGKASFPYDEPKKVNAAARKAEVAPKAEAALILARFRKEEAARKVSLDEAKGLRPCSALLNWRAYQEVQKYPDGNYYRNSDEYEEAVFRGWS